MRDQDNKVHPHAEITSGNLTHPVHGLWTCASCLQTVAGASAVAAAEVVGEAGTAGQGPEAGVAGGARVAVGVGTATVQGGGWGGSVVRDRTFPGTETDSMASSETGSKLSCHDIINQQQQLMENPSRSFM